MYNKSLNKHSQDWRKVPKKLEYNKHLMKEIQFDLKDSVLLGSSSSVGLTREVINKFQLMFNDFLMRQESFEKLKKKYPDYAESNSVILNYYMQKVYNLATTEGMTNEQWKAKHREIQDLVELAKDTSSAEWFHKIDDYYQEELKKLNETLNDNINK